ncbi:MAG: NAD(P)H-binding protein [Mycobacterium sp.]|uniref:SDR family oxidoreductase n=1 Tax=Mycobacterium sp. TaxID=1785 RepID=UPI003C560714
MKITVLGATGLIGKDVVASLNDAGHQTVAASRGSGADVLTGEGLPPALAGANVLVDVINSPSYDDDPVMQFFTTATKNLVDAAKSANVGHYVALSIVNCDGLPESGYMRAKVVQESAITESELPYTIVRATQFHEFAEGITDSMTVGDEVRVPDGPIQPIAAAEVAAEVARVAQAEPVNGVVNIGGPQKLRFADMANLVVTHRGGTAPVIVDPSARYFGTLVSETSLVTGDDAVLADIRLADWLAAHDPT